MFLQPEGKTNKYHVLQSDQVVSFDNTQIGLSWSDFPNQNWSQQLNQEFQRETDISKVGEDQQKFYEAELQKIKRIKENFESARDKVQKHEENQGNAVSLTQKERKSLLNVFEGFYNLDQKRSSLSLQLQKASHDEFKLVSANLDSQLKKDVKQALNKINWSNGELKVKKSGNKEGRNQANFYGWGTFEKSPFKTFYTDKEKLLKDIQEWDNSLRRETRRATQERQRCTFAIIGIGGKRSSHTNTCQPNTQEFKRKAQKSKDAIEMHIAKWLLTKMGQFSNQKLEKK